MEELEEKKIDEKSIDGLVSEKEITAKLEHNHPTQGEVEWVRSTAY